MGNYDELEGGLFENSALYLSGGIYQEYKTEEVLNAPKKGTPVPNLKPDSNDLFEITKIALQKKDMVGCVLENVRHFQNIIFTLNNLSFFYLKIKDEIARKYGLFKLHFYLVIDFFIAEKVNYLKIHNPHNTPENLKKYFFFKH